MMDEIINFKAGDLYFHKKINRNVIVCENKSVYVLGTILTTGWRNQSQYFSVMRGSMPQYMKSMEK